MGGACLNGGGSFDECMLDAELEARRERDRYDTLESVRKHRLYKDTFIVEESDKNKGRRITYVNSSNGAIVREEKYDCFGRRR
jgi:hypothetical protein